MASDSPYIRVSARAIIVRDGRLLVQHYREGEVTWCVTPGGGIEKGERLDDGLKREVLEETGLEIEVGPLRYIRELRGVTRIKLLGGLSPDFHAIEHIFEARIVRAVPGAVIQPDNYATDTEWLPLDGLAAAGFYPEPLQERLPRDLVAGFPGGAVYLGDA